MSEIVNFLTHPFSFSNCFEKAKIKIRSNNYGNMNYITTFIWCKNFINSNHKKFLFVLSLILLRFYCFFCELKT